MRPIRPRRPSAFVATLVLAGALPGLLVPAAPLRAQGPPQERPLPPFEAFVAQAKAKLQTDAALQSGYAFSERRTEQNVDADGRVVEQHVKVFEVYPALPGEEPYRRLIEEDGKRVPAAELEKKDRERQKKAEEYARKVASRSASDREKAEREYQKEMKERTADIDDIFNVFDVRMVGREVINSHDTIVFTLTPRPNAKARTDSGKIMQHFTARVWISETEYELVKVDVEAIDTITFGLGLLARLHAGTTVMFERRKVNGEAWLPAKVTYSGSGRLLLLKKLRVAGSSEFFDYRKFSVETETTLGAPVSP